MKLNLLARRLRSPPPRLPPRAPPPPTCWRRGPGPYGGAPNFAAVRVADFAPALETGMADEQREIDAIANNPAPPTFDNTIVAMEKAGDELNRVQTIFGVWTGNLKTPEVAAVETAMAPKLSAFGDAITQNPKFSRGSTRSIIRRPRRS